MNEIIKNNYDVYPKGKSFKWLGDSNKYVFSEGDELRYQNPGEKSSHTLLSLDMLNGIAKDNGIEVFKRLPNITWQSENDGYFYRRGDNGSLTLNTLSVSEKSVKEVNTLPANAENVTLNEKTFRIAYTIDNDLYIADGGKQIRLTENPEHVIAGQSVHRNEFAIDGGIFWSPDGNKLAYYLMDESMVTDYPLVDITTRIAEAKPIKYPMAGMTSHIVKLHVYDIAAGTDVVMQTGEPEEHYLTAITWNNDNEKIYIGILNRGQDTLNFNEYNTLNGEFCQTIFHDEDEQYVEPQGPAHFLPGSTTEFVWLAQRDGYYHLWLHNTKTLKAKQIEKGNYVAKATDVTSLLASDELISKQNMFLSFKGLTVEAQDDGSAFLYNWDGSGSHDDNSDLYFNVSVDGKTYTFTVESYLCGNDTEVYKAVEGLKVGDKIDAEGFLYWYNGVNPHITKISK